MPTLTFTDDSEVYGFLRCLEPLFGSPKAALEAFIRSTPTFQIWRAKVAECPACHQYVPIVQDRLDRHLVRNPVEDRPYWIECSGTAGIADPTQPNPMELAVIRAHIEHRIDTLQPGLL